MLKLMYWYRRLRYRYSSRIDFVLAGVARSGGAPFAFTANVVIARMLGSEGFGIYVTMLSVALVAGVMASYGVGPVLTREIAAQPENRRRAMVLTMGLWALRLTGGLSLCLVIAVLVWLNFGPRAPSASSLERLAVSCIVPMYVWAILVRSVLGGLSHVAKGQLVENIGRNSVLCVGVGILFLAGIGHVTDILWLQVLSFALPALLGTYWIFCSISRCSEQYTPTYYAEALLGSGCARDSHYAEWRKSARDFFAMSVAVLILVRLDVVIVNALAGPVQAGLFGAAARLNQVSTIAGLVWMAWLQPRMAQEFRVRKLRALKRSLSVGVIGSTSMTSFLVGFGWVLAPKLMALMGTDFNDAVWPFRWLLLGSLIWGIGVPFNTLLSMSAREQLVSKVLWVQVVLTVVSSVPLVLSFGAVGGAWAWAGGMGISNLILIIAGLRSKVAC